MAAATVVMMFFFPFPDFLWVFRRQIASVAVMVLVLPELLHLRSLVPTFT